MPATACVHTRKYSTLSLSLLHLFFCLSITLSLNPQMCICPAKVQRSAQNYWVSSPSSSRFSRKFSFAKNLLSRMNGVFKLWPLDPRTKLSLEFLFFLPPTRNVSRVGEQQQLKVFAWKEMQQKSSTIISYDSSVTFLSRSQCLLGGNDTEKQDDDSLSLSLSLSLHEVMKRKKGMIFVWVSAAASSNEPRNFSHHFFHSFLLYVSLRCWLWRAFCSLRTVGEKKAYPRSNQGDWLPWLQHENQRLFACQEAPCLPAIKRSNCNQSSGHSCLKSGLTISPFLLLPRSKTFKQLVMSKGN